MRSSNYRYLRISVTDRCDLACKYCRNDGAFDSSKKAVMSFEEIVLAVKCLNELGISHIRLTGGEPLLRNDLHKLVGSLVPLADSISMTTNGTRLADDAMLLRTAGLKTINIHIDTLDAMKFKRLTGGRIADVLAGINSAVTAGIQVKFNTVLLRGINDHEVDELMNFAASFGAPVRFIELMPFCDEQFYKEYFMPVAEVVTDLELGPVNSAFGNGPAAYYRDHASGAVVGFISSVSRKFCGECDRLRLTSDGRLKRCLADESSLDLRACGFSRDAVEEYLSGKEFDHKDYSRVEERTLRAIGG